MSSVDRDDNYVPNIAGVDDITYTGTVEPAVNGTDHSLHVCIQEVVPTSAVKTNGSATLTYDASGNLTQIDKVISGVTYRKTFTWTSGNLTDISVWSIP